MFSDDWVVYLLNVNFKTNVTAGAAGGEGEGVENQ